MFAFNDYKLSKVSTSTASFELNSSDKSTISDQIEAEISLNTITEGIVRQITERSNKSKSVFSTNANIKNQTTTESVTENTAPIAGLEYAIINPETLRDGQITTKTQIAWLWSYDGQNFTYDPGGDSLNWDISGVPKGYIIGEYNDGFVTQISCDGQYTMSFYVADEHGALSNVVTYNLNIIQYTDYQVFEGDFNSQSDVNSYDVTVDFSKTPSVAFCFVSTGQTGLNATIKDASGTVVKSFDTYLPGQYGIQAKNYTSIIKPVGQEDISPLMYLFLLKDT